MRMIRFRLFGITIHVQPFFWLIMAYLGGGVRLLTNPSSDDLVKTVVFIVAGFISIVVHELGHALMMQKYGRIPQVVLHGMGGVAISSGVPLSRMQNFLVTLMGPVAQVILGLIALFILKTVGSNFPPGYSEQFVTNLCYVSIFWALINLIPIHPLDGGQLLASLVGPSRKKIVHIVGIIIGGLALAYMLMSGWGMLGVIIVGMLIFDNIKALQK